MVTSWSLPLLLVSEKRRKTELFMGFCRNPGPALLSFLFCLLSLELGIELRTARMLNQQSVYRAIPLVTAYFLKTLVSQFPVTHLV